jgi:hypothetical protein
MTDVGEKQVISLADAASFTQALGPTPAGAVLSRVTSHNMTGQQLTSFIKRQIAQLKKHVGAGRVGRWEPESLHAYLRSPLHGVRPPLVAIRKSVFTS